MKQTNKKFAKKNVKAIKFRKAWCHPKIRVTKVNTNLTKNMFE